MYQATSKDTHNIQVPQLQDGSWGCLWVIQMRVGFSTSESPADNPMSLPLTEGLGYYAYPQKLPDTYKTMHWQILGIEDTTQLIITKNRDVRSFGVSGQVVRYGNKK